jgi:hypothetical protein
MEENIIVKRNTPRDLFLHLLAIVTLYWSAISFVTLIWQYINYFLPDVLNYYYQSTNYAIRFAVSSLVIVFPIFILVSWYLNKIYRREAVVRESKIRKWLIYLTMFITSLVMIGDLVSTINMFLGGEITSRFILKALSILIVAAVIFGYYLNDVRRETPTNSAKYFAWGTSILVLAAIIGSFFMIGSPMTARLLQFDQQKVSDLQGIQQQVVNYYQRKAVLPNSLSDLNDSISGFTIPIDPQSGVSYEYAVKDETFLGFELCATFNKESTVGSTVSAPTSVYLTSNIQNWNHSAGFVCFERTIDKQLYPLLNK